MKKKLFVQKIKILYKNLFFFLQKEKKRKKKAVKITFMQLIIQHLASNKRKLDYY